MFQSFNRSGHAQLSTEIVAELEALGAKHGLTFKASGGAIGATDLTFKIVAATADIFAIEQQARSKIDVYGRGYGLQGSDYGLVFTSNGKRFKFTGVSPSRPKFPIDGECLSTGKSFKFTRAAVQMIVAARPKPLSPAQAAMVGAIIRTPEKLDPALADYAQF